MAGKRRSGKQSPTRRRTSIARGAAPVLAAVLGLSTVGAAALGAAAPPAAPVPDYRAAGAVALGAPDRWDYVVVDPASGRVYLAHGDRLEVIDGRRGALVGRVEGVAGGTHGTALWPAGGKGYTDDGRNGLVVGFDLKTLKATTRIPVGADADAMTFDPASGHVFVIRGEPGGATAIDPATGKVVADIPTDEGLEYAAADGRGALFVAGAQKRDLLRIDTRADTVTNRWPTPDCASPHGLAYDARTRRVFMGCLNAKMMVIDAASGRVVAELDIGKGSDAVAFDPVRRRVFSANGLDGTITVFQQRGPDDYLALAPIVTDRSGRTMGVDPRTGRLFVAAAATDPPTAPGGRPRPRPGTLRLLFYDPVG